MHTKRFLRPVILAVALMTGSGQDMVNMIGLGNASCGKWIEVRCDRRDLAFEQWVLGFLSGAAWKGPQDPLHEVGTAAVDAWMDNYCRAHPLEAIVDAAEAFVHEHPH
jgi:hypothetical protein